MKHYALIGKDLRHSWSADFFNRKFKEEGIDAVYDLLILDHVATLKPLSSLDGYNVTIPFKCAVIPYLDEIDPIAKQIGAVNVVKNGKGYNTDFIGFTESIRPYLHNQQYALIIGSGGAARAVEYGLQTLHITSKMVSARTPITENLAQYDIIVNCTPLGQFPNTTTCPPIDYAAITPKHVLFDCVYNPEQTLFLQKGKQQGATTISGKQMLEIQALESWKIWNTK